MLSISGRRYNTNIQLILLGLILVLIVHSCNKTPDRPNIVLFLADDLSYADLSYHGHPVVQTPNVDLLAGEGVSLTHMFTPTAMCAPSRSALYTGLYPHRNGCHMNHGKVKKDMQSLPHYLKPLGYHVALVNKRHVGPAKAFPFDYVHKDSVEFYLEGLNGEPFCLIYASDEPHGPHSDGRIKEGDVQVPPTWINSPEARKKYARYLNDVEKMDAEFGSLITMLKNKKLYEDAVCIFTSDHGYEYFAKWTCYENGLRVPFFIKWKQLEAGTNNHAMIHFVDVLPGIVELAGGSPPQNIDGSSFIGVLIQGETEHRDLIFGCHTNRGIISGNAYPVRSVRNRQWKYIRNLNADSLFQNVLTHGWTFSEEDAGPVWKSWKKAAEKDDMIAERVHFLVKRPTEELYDLLNDPFELENLAGDPGYADIKSNLSASLDQWMEMQGDHGLETEMKVPIWKAK